jgi:hypothetical protein
VAIKQMPEMEKRVVAHVFANYKTVQRNYAGELVEVLPTAARGDEIEVPVEEAARLEQFGTLAPRGWSPGDVFAAIEARRAAVEETIRRGVNPTEGLPHDLFAGPRVTVSPPGGGAEPEGYSMHAGDVGMPDVQPAAAPADDRAAAGRALNREPVGGADAAEGYDARGRDLTEVAAWIEAAKPNAQQTVAAARDDAAAAETVLEAERLTHGGDPRSTVEGPLQRIIESEGQGGDEEG